MNSLCEQAAATHGNTKRVVEKFKPSPEMLHFIQESGKNIPGSLEMEPNMLTHSIIKDKKTDKKLQALIIAERLLYCSPLHI
jgi:hypothetical protein